MKAEITDCPLEGITMYISSSPQVTDGARHELPKRYQQPTHTPENGSYSDRTINLRDGMVIENV